MRSRAKAVGWEGSARQAGMRGRAQFLQRDRATRRVTACALPFRTRPRPGKQVFAHGDLFLGSV